MNISAAATAGVDPEFLKALPERLISNLDHAVINVPDLEQGVAWYKRFLGLYETAREPGLVYLGSPVTGRTILGIAEGGIGLRRVSFALSNPEFVDKLAAILPGQGFEVERFTAASRPGSRRSLRVKIPTGHVLELLDAEDEKKKGVVPPAYTAGAIDVRISHLQLRTQDVLEMSRALQTLGFRVTGYVPHPDPSAEKHIIQFLRANEHHHQLALLTGPAGFHHVALELEQADFWKFCDHLAHVKIPAEYGPGRHYEGFFNFLYVRDPFGNRTEITSPMGQVGYDYPGAELTGDPNFHMNMWGPQPPQSWLTEWT